MWRMSCGECVLTGKERSLLVHGAACLLDYLLEGSLDVEPDTTLDWPTGVELFDRLLPEARIVLLRDVVRALTDPTVPVPALTATNEAAVHAVFRHLHDQVALEIDGAAYDRNREPDDLLSMLGHDPCSWRRLVLAASREGRELNHPSAEGGDADLDPACDDLGEWDLLLEILADQILWDRDWELEDEIVDAAPERARLLKRHLRIDPDYFIAAPPGEDARQVEEAVHFLRRLVGEDRQDQE